MTFKIKMTVTFVLLAFTSITMAGEQVKKLKPSFGIALESYLVADSNVSSIDVLIDYAQVEVGCEGPSAEYAYFRNEKSFETIVLKKGLSYLPEMCDPSTPKNLIQSGIKITLYPKSNNTYISERLFAPKGSVVEMISHSSIK